MNDQQRDALQRGNERRLAQAHLKAVLRAMTPACAGRRLVEVIADDPPPDEIAQARVYVLLVACPRIGEKKAARIMRAAGAGESKRLHNLTPRQRDALIDGLQEFIAGWVAYDTRREAVAA